MVGLSELKRRAISIEAAKYIANWMDSVSSEGPLHALSWSVKFF
jgi:hypothetical protein